MAAALSVEVHAIPGDTGQWCPRCALPSAQHVRAIVASTATLRVLTSTAAQICHDCGHTERTTR